MVSKALLWVVWTGFFLASPLHAEEEAPSLDFLEFLADVETGQGEWLDPLDMNEVASNEKNVKPERVKSDEDE